LFLLEDLVQDRGRRRWWVFGCVIVLAAVFLAVATLAGLTWWSSRSAEPRSSVLVHERPASDLETLQEPEPRTYGTPLKVVLELDSCEVYIEPAAPGEPLAVEAHYDAHDYRLEEIVEEEIPDTYRLRFLVTSSRLITGLKQGLRGGQPQLRIRLPVDTPLEFKLLQRNGGAIVDLGGLHLLSADFDVGGAILKVDAGDRLQGALERLTVIGNQGGLIVENLDLMQPQRVEVDFRMGQAMLDFRGTWTSDTGVDLSMSMADAILRLPREARVTGLDTYLSVSRPGEERRPATLAFSVESGTRTVLRVFD
jgi:hypothetical protein